MIALTCTRPRRAEWSGTHGAASSQAGITVIDSPYLSHATAGLREAVQGLDAVVFADVCKQGQGPLASIIAELQATGDLPAAWQHVAALRTFNPLGCTATFTSEVKSASQRTRHPPRLTLA